MPTASPGTDGATAGNCTEDDSLTGIPTIYTLLTSDVSEPVTLIYTEFNTDGSTPTRTEVLTGATNSRVGFACDEETSGEIWTLTATTSSTGSLACVLGFGGKIVAQDSAFAESNTPVDLRVDCSGNPGR